MISWTKKVVDVVTRDIVIDSREAKLKIVAYYLRVNYITDTINYFDVSICKGS